MNGFCFSFVVKMVVIHAVAQVGSVEILAPQLNLAVAGEGVIVLGGIDDVAPSVEDDELVHPSTRHR